MSTRKLRWIALLAAFLMLAAACGSDDDSDNAQTDSPSEDSSDAGNDDGAGDEGAGGDEASGGESVDLSIWVRESAAGTVQTAADAYNALGGDQIEVTSIPNDDFVTTFGAALAAGDGPDLVSIDLILTPAFIDEGQLQPIGDLIDSLPFGDTLSPAHITLGTGLDGERYAVPFAAEGSFLVYNIDLFEQAGLDPDNPPTNYQEIYDAAEAISALGDDIHGFWFSGACAGCNAFTFAPLIWASGGDVLSEDFQSATLDSDPAVADALQFYQDMWNAGFIPPEAETDAGPLFLSAFGGGNIGMAGSGAFAVSALPNDFPDVNFGVTFLPGKDGGVGSFAGGDHVAIPTGSEYRDEAFEFIAWLFEEEQQLSIYAENGSLPLRTDLSDTDRFPDERYRTGAEAMALGNTPYSLVYLDLFNDPNGPWLQMIQEAVFDGDVDGAVATAQENFTEILAG